MNKKELERIIRDMENDKEIMENCRETLGDFCYYKEHQNGIVFNVNICSQVVGTTVEQSSFYEKQWGCNTKCVDEYVDVVTYDRFNSEALELYKSLRKIIKFNDPDYASRIIEKYNTLEEKIVSVKNQLEEAKLEMCRKPNEFTEEKAIRIAKLSKEYQYLLSNPLLSYYSRAFQALTLGKNNQLDNNTQSKLVLKSN